MNMGTLNNVAPLLWTQLRVRKVLLWMEDPPWVGEDEYEGGEANLHELILCASEDFPSY